MWCVCVVETESDKQMYRIHRYSVTEKFQVEMCPIAKICQGGVRIKVSQQEC